MNLKDGYLFDQSAWKAKPTTPPPPAQPAKAEPAPKGPTNDDRTHVSERPAR